MQIQLSDHFDYKKLFRFVLPSIGMIVFTSIYGVVDGFFVSNYAGKTQFAGLNLIMPFLMLFNAFGFMIGSGGSALIAKTLGEGNSKLANNIFSMLIYLLILIGIVCTIFCQIFLKQIAMFFGATGDLLKYSVLYGRIFSLGFCFFMLQAVFQTFLIVAERPNLGLAVTLIAGFGNMIFDALFVGLFRWGIAGAAAATIISMMLGGGIPLVYFIFPNKNKLHLGKPYFNGVTLFKVCSNGLSELLTNISMSFVNMAYNFQLMRMIGEKGVSTFGVIMYVCFIFIAIFIGYTMGVSPVTSFNYGAENYDELKSLRRKSMVVISCSAVLLFALAEISSDFLSKLFVGYDAELLAQTKTAFRLYSISFLICGFNIFGSGFFTSLNNGIVSGIISFSRVLLFQITAVFVLPLIFGVNGIWLAIVAAELCSLAVTVSFTIWGKKKYRY